MVRGLWCCAGVAFTRSQVQATGDPELGGGPSLALGGLDDQVICARGGNAGCLT